MTELSVLLKQRRTDRGLSQKELGNLCGLSDTTINKMENDCGRVPQWDTLCKVAKALDISVLLILTAAGFVSEEEINPELRLHGLDTLGDADLISVQQYIDFLNYVHGKGAVR